MLVKAQRDISWDQTDGKTVTRIRAASGEQFNVEAGLGALFISRGMATAVKAKRETAKK